MSLPAEGYVVVDHDPGMAGWARAARHAAEPILADAGQRAQWLRHGQTWFVGVDALPTGPDGAILGVPLGRAWRAFCAAPDDLHRAQLSVTYRGYPQRDPEETEQAHRYRVRRCAAHVDGLLPEDGRRYPREPHAFILGLPLNEAPACPLTVWPGSQRIIGAALRAVIGDRDPRGVDVTEAYTNARKQVFEEIAPRPITAMPGQAIVLHRHLLHGIAPDDPAALMPEEGRMMAYFRPLLDDPRAWVAPD